RRGPSREPARRSGDPRRGAQGVRLRRELQKVPDRRRVPALQRRGARVRRIKRVLTPAEWKRLGWFGAAVLALHVVGWGLFVYYSQHDPALAGLGTLAYTFGLRHAFHADHIAAIDNTTRKFPAEGK